MTKPTPLSEGFDEALDVLRSGGLVAVPTETVYGLGADATNADAIGQIYEAKGRPSFNPLIAHVSGLEMAERFGVFNPLARKLAGQFWPGPLTLVVPVRDNTSIAPAVTAGLETIAMRHPHGIMAELAKSLDRPIAAPSANSSGKISPTTAQHVVDDLGARVDVILDGGRCDIGLESTIVKIEAENIVLLREGGIPRETLESFLGTPLEVLKRPTDIEAPGQLLAHYAPSLPVRLNADQPKRGEAYLAFGPGVVGDRIGLNLSEGGDLEEAAHNLFAMLKELDASGAEAIAIQSIPKHGLGAAINDRLKRAAHQEKKTETVE